MGAPTTSWARDTGFLIQCIQMGGFPVDVDNQRWTKPII
jgi:hypothetical protein